jgi:glutaminyl-tRNA synthetase
MGVLEECVRTHLNDVAPRRIAVLDPLKLFIDNYAVGQIEHCGAPNHPQKPEQGSRQLLFTRELWIERDDFMATPSKGYFRLYPGNRVRLKYAYIIECTGFDSDADGRVTAVHANYLADSLSGTAGADQYKVKGNVHWVSTESAVACEVRLYDRLFRVPHPGAGERDFILDLNPDSKCVVRAQLEPALARTPSGESVQFERHGYFVADRVDSKPGAPIFNRTVTLRDSWAKAAPTRS